MTQKPKETCQSTCRGPLLSQQYVVWKVDKLFGHFFTYLSVFCKCWVSEIIHLIAGLKSFRKLTKNLPLDAGLNVFEPNPSSLEPWNDGIKACNKLMKKNVQERLNMANEIWQRYEDNLEEVSKRKQKN